MRRSGFVSVVGGSLLVLALVLGACRTEISSGPGGGSQGSPSGGNPSAEGDQVPGNQVPGDQPAEEEIPSTPAARFFWGTWIRMDNGAHYKVYEDTVTQEDGGAIYYVSPSSTTERMVVSGLGTFTKESDSVIMNGSIPYFRKGGANPSYRMRLVGFVGGPSRAAATTIHGWKVTGTSGSYPTYTNTSKSDENGEFTLRAPVVGDTQTVTVSTDSGVIVVPGLTIENSGDFMGTIPLVDSGDYILKITGSIAPEEKLDGYLYGNSYKRYPMTLTITNVSQVKSAMAVCVVEWDDPNLSVTSSQNLEGIPISTMAPGATKTIDLEVLYGHLTEPYVDTEIKVRITNAQTGKEWVDYVPLRFFRGQVSLTVAAASPEGNQAAALNGFLVHPDGQSQFFSAPHGGSSTIYAPTFPESQPYLMAFSGATVTGELSDSTEMFYTVAVGSTEPVKVETSGGGILRHMTFGEPNDSKKTAYPVNGNFQAYLSEGEIDYFSVTSDTWELVSIGEQCTISYNSDGGGVVRDKKVYKGTRLNIYHLPTLTKEGHDFDGWYSGGVRVESGYQVQGDEMLTARWKIHQYTVSYSTERGSAPAAKTYDYNTALSASDLPQLSQYGYTFGGWYSGSTKIEAGHKLTAPLSLTAQWTPVKYTVSYSTERGGTVEDKSYAYNTTLGTAGLPSLTATGYTHTGWQVEGAAATADYVVTKNVILTATWEIQRYTVNYTTAHGSKPAAKTYDYNTALSASDLPQLSQYGYTFGGWYSGSTKIEAGHKLTAPLSLTAQWTPVKYTVSYSTERGGTVEDKPYDYNTTLGTAGLPRLTATGYTHTGWQVEGKTAAADYVVTKNVILTATWTPNTNTRYTVRHHQQNVTGEGYTLVSGDTEAKTGTTDATTAAAAKSYTGFTAKGITQETIAPDGSTVVDVYYDRNIINLTLDLDGGSTTTALSGGMLSGRYGAPVSLVAPTKSGWHFTGWNTSGGTLPTTFTEPGTYKALWTGAGVSVTVAPVSDIQVRQQTDGTTVTLTADAGYTSYQWKVDGVVQNGQTSKVLELDTSSWVTGTYEVFLLVQDGGLYKSASLRITK